MTISQDLIDRYTTEVDVDWRHAFILTHPTAGNQYLIDHTEQYEGFYGRQIKNFWPVPTEIVLPSRNTEGRHHMSIMWCGIRYEAKSYLDNALNDPTKSIKCLYSVFILGDRDPQINPWIEFSLTDINISSTAVTATATRADILNKIFPSKIYRPDEYPGLRRR